jgi:hypothetical protein
MGDVLLIFEQYLEDRLTLVTAENPIVILNGDHGSELQAIVTVVADGAALTCFASAKFDSLCAFRSVKNGFNAGAIVGIVTKRLRRTATAGAPFIGCTFLNLDEIGKRLCYDGIGHYCAPCSGRQITAAICRRYQVNGRFESIESAAFFWQTSAP